MFSNARGMAICIGVTGVASILLWFYFKNRIETVETKLDNMFNMIQNFSQPPESETVARNEVADYYQQVGGDGVVDPFEQKYGEEIQYENQNSSPQLPTEIFEKEIENVVNNTKLIEVSEDSGEDSSSEEEGESEDESEEEKVKEETIPVSNEEEVVDSLDEIESEDESEDEKGNDELKEEVKEYSHMKVSELKKLAQTKGLTGYTKLNKAGLVNLLENN